MKGLNNPLIKNTAAIDRCGGLSDEQIIDRVKKNKDCYFCLMVRYEEKIIRYIRRLSKVSLETAQDIAQNVFLKIFVNLNEFDNNQKFSSWIYRIAHNETINYWRKNNQADYLTLSWDGNEPLKSIIKDNWNTESQVYQKINNEKVIKAMGQLDDKYKKVMELNYFSGQSYQEIADQLGKPIGTIGTLISRGKKILRIKLSEMGITANVALG